MATVTYEKQITALLVIDPYNDFISEGGKDPVPSSSRSQARSSQRSIGVPAALPTPIWICSSRSTAYQLIVIGLIAHTCIEATVRFAAELGYEVTVVKDATADYSDEMMHAALDINMPNYASAIVTTKEVISSISSL
jgi:nicotinamidase-related amidase